MTTNSAAILIVDDNRDNRTILARRLERNGYQAATADDGIQALAALEKDTYDLVLLDVLMRDMDGMETLTEIRKQYFMLQLPVIMVSALTDTQNTVDALKSGANDYVTKPVDTEALLARIQTQLTLREQEKP